MAVILNCNSITKLQILASSSSSSSSSPPNNSSSPNFKPNNNNLSEYSPQDKLKQLKKNKGERQPSVLEIERAIGAGMFRDRDTNNGAEEKNNMFEKLLKNSIGENESSLEKQLRESGEWLINQSEKTSRSAGKQILMTMFLWILPAWIFAFLLASGIVQLPIPFIEEMFS